MTRLEKEFIEDRIAEYRRIEKRYREASDSAFMEHVRQDFRDHADEYATKANALEDLLSDLLAAKLISLL